MSIASKDLSPMHSKLCTIMAFSALLAACASTAASVSTSARPSPDEAHLPSTDPLLGHSHVVEVATPAESVYRVLVPLDDTVKHCSTEHCAPEHVQVLFEGNGTLIFVDQYDHAAAPSPHCRNGFEQFLRVVHPAVPSEEADDVLETQINVKLASCYDDITLAGTNPVSWDPSTRTLTVDWDSGQGSSGSERRETFHVGEE